jgi:arginine N-succinyltransferase
MRGFQDDSGASPVWEALGREFYDMEFVEADQANAITGNQFIADLAPKHPIYASLLPKVAREALGRPHDDGRRAFDMLLDEGFRFEGYIDIFDGGPTLCAAIDDLRAVRESRTIQVGRVVPDGGAGDQLVSAGVGPEFRAARGGLTADDDGRAVVDEGLARGLDIHQGDWVRYVAF